MCTHLLGCFAEDIAYVLLSNIHAQGAFVLIDHHFLGVAFVHVCLKLRISGFLIGCDTPKERCATVREEEYGKQEDDDSVKPVHIELGHLRLLVSSGIVVIVHVLLLRSFIYHMKELMPYGFLPPYNQSMLGTSVTAASCQRSSRL